MKILITGASGYIGSHTVLALLDKGYDCVLVDNFANSEPSVIESLKQISNKKFDFYQIDLCELNKVEDLFKEYKFDAVIHFAALKSPTISCQEPLNYYYVNLCSLLNVLECMNNYDCRKFVFSSSAAIYHKESLAPIDESNLVEPVTPYGNTKAIAERVLVDICNSNPNWKIIALRYFNPVGAHPSGLIGEKPMGIPNNLFPRLFNVALKLEDSLNIFGNDWDTVDGTGVRDYIHTQDLASGHVAALEYLENNTENFLAVNLGTGKGYSVMEVINKFKSITGININYKFASRRQGDVAQSFADVTLARQKLFWSATKGLEEMLEDGWRFRKQSSSR